MNINIYYGGRGIIDDPTIYVIDKMQEVLEELRVKVVRYNLFENKNAIPTLPQTLKNADGIILATTVEWYGIGGYMQQFLDSCWLFGNKEKISQIYMMPVVMSTTFGEKEAELALATAWEILGGRPCSGVSGYIENTMALEMNEDYGNIIAKKAENMYRTVNQKMVSLPASNNAVKQQIARPKGNTLTIQESEQLSQYVADDSYVQQQKEDLQELANLFRDKLSSESDTGDEEYVREIRKAYRPQAGFKAVYSISIGEKKKKLAIHVDGSSLECKYEELQKSDIEMSMDKKTMDSIVGGKMTFQRAFMAGSIKMKGDFKIMRTLDQIFLFDQK